MLSKLWKPLFDRRKEDELFTGYEEGMPSHQNAVNLVPGWSCHFPSELGLQAGQIPAFSDPRIAWAIESFGSLEGRSVLELGPLEAAHTSMLANAGAHVDAVESNQLAFFKCLITREILSFPNARFYLGDFVKWLEQNDKTYDLIVASGVLYHMRDPLRLLQAMANRSNAIYLWTVIVNDDNLKPNSRQMFNGVDVRLYARGYGARDVKYCGGPTDFPRWMHRDDIVAVLKTLGFTNLTIAHDVEANPGNFLPTFSIFATRPTLS